METILHKANTRGTANFGWLNSKHTFSFGHYYDPDRVNFGALRVLNDDIVEPGMGFGTHPHDNMEIISIPLSGSLAHKDSTGNEEVIKTGEVQIMSAGTGITHSEYNHSKSEKVNFLQIWVIPEKRDIKPRYGQKEFSREGRINKIQTVVSPNGDETLWINQNSWFSLSSLNSDKSVEYELKSPKNGLYIFLIDGSIKVGDTVLDKRDGLGIINSEKVSIEALQNSEILLIDVPVYQ